MEYRPSIPVKKNEIIDLTIDDLAVDGSGIGHFCEFTIFVPLSAPGDRLRVRVLKVTKNCAYGKIESIKTASSFRVMPDCSVFSKCGGCCFRHISYEAELAYKEKRVRDTLQRIGGFHDVHINPIVGAGQRNRYRNKCLMPVGFNQQLEIGFYAPHSHRIINCEDCLLQPAEFTDLIQVIRSFILKYQISIYDEASHTGLLRRLFLRKAEVTGEISICIVLNGVSLPYESEFVRLLIDHSPHIKSVVINSNTQKTNVALGNQNRVIFGSETIQDILCGLRFSVSPRSFYQVNRTQAERLYLKAGEYAHLTGNEILLDLYCGTGTIGLSMAVDAKKLIGVEIISEAVENAKNNALQNGIKNAVFYCEDAAEAVLRLKQDSIKPDVVILDPPRKGCSPETIDLIIDLTPKRIVYISCDPATLARDLKLFVQKGYTVSEVTPYDLFPATAHTEAVCLLKRA